MRFQPTQHSLTIIAKTVTHHGLGQRLHGQAAELQQRQAHHLLLLLALVVVLLALVNTDERSATGRRRRALVFDYGGRNRLGASAATPNHLDRIRRPPPAAPQQWQRSPARPIPRPPAVTRRVWSVGCVGLVALIRAAFIARQKATTRGNEVECNKNRRPLSRSGSLAPSRAAEHNEPRTRRKARPPRTRQSVGRAGFACGHFLMGRGRKLESFEPPIPSVTWDLNLSPCLPSHFQLPPEAIHLSAAMPMPLAHTMHHQKLYPV